METIVVKVGKALIMSHALYHRTGFTDRNDRNLRIHVSLTRADEDQSNDAVDYLITAYHLKDIKVTPAEVKTLGLDVNRKDLHEDVRSQPSDAEDDEEEGGRERPSKRQKHPTKNSQKSSC